MLLFREVREDQALPVAIQCVLGIPKGDTNVWTDRKVRLPDDFPAGKYRTIGFPASGQDELIPLDWSQNVMVERYE